MKLETDYPLFVDDFGGFGWMKIGEMRSCLIELPLHGPKQPVYSPPERQLTL
jgi:hypothetical protein